MIVEWIITVLILFDFDKSQTDIHRKFSNVFFKNACILLQNDV